MKKDCIVWPYFANIALWASVIAIIFMLSGCSTITSAWNYGKAANDRALEGAEAVLCSGASSGAINRRYGLNSERARARRVLCGLDGIAR